MRIIDLAKFLLSWNVRIVFLVNIVQKEISSSEIESSVHELSSVSSTRFELAIISV